MELLKRIGLSVIVITVTLVIGVPVVIPIVICTPVIAS